MRSFSDDLNPLHAASLHRTLRLLDSPQLPVVRSAGRELLNFSSNDYLGFASASAVREAFKRGIDQHGAGSGASRLVCGTQRPHAELEAALAHLKKTQAALTFSSGYAAAVGCLPALCGPDDFIILDKLAHASLIDGARLSGATIRVFPHNHLEKLEHLLQWARSKATAASRVLVVTESVFSMDGDWAELWDIVRLKETYGALLLVDEAHAFGIMGPQGRGLAAKLGISSRVDIHMGTLSKAAGLSGAYLCGSRELTDLLINRARSFIYSTAPSPALAAAALEVVGLLLPGAYGEERRSRLWRNLALLTEALEGRIPEPSSAIVPLIIGTEDEALRLSRLLEEEGILIPAIRFPTVARGKARLRLTMTAIHTEDQIRQLAATLLPLLPSFPA
ncbi:MAG: 8-amino-7-oxononanoate synthase [Verrucomicrobiaceae bacterium]|nr:MAG: 8-amino-7-oxononanoate synthase [Verrucomicrobiaceae bacterium]